MWLIAKPIHVMRTYASYIVRIKRQKKLHLDSSATSFTTAAIREPCWNGWLSEDLLIHKLEC